MAGHRTWSGWAWAAAAVAVLSGCAGDDEKTRAPARALEWTDRHPSWAPDSRRIVFSSNRGPRARTIGDFDLYVVNADGTGLRRLTRSTADEAEPEWAPRGDAVVYVFNPGGVVAPQRSEIHVIGAGGSVSRRLTKNDVPDFRPTWSPDGTKIAFARSGAAATGLYVMDATGVAQRRLAANVNPIAGFAWAPDGESVVFVGGAGSLYVVGLDGAPATRVTRGEPASSPAWSPDGSAIAFRAEADGSLRLVGADGRGQRPLAGLPPGTGFADDAPQWLPDGRLLTGVRRGGLYVEDGQDARKLAPDGFFPRIAPNGRSVAYERVHPAPSYTPVPSGICLLRLDGGGRRMITQKRLTLPRC